MTKMRPGYWIGILAVPGAVAGHSMHTLKEGLNAYSGTVIGAAIGVIAYAIL